MGVWGKSAGLACPHVTPVTWSGGLFAKSCGHLRKGSKRAEFEDCWCNACSAGTYAVDSDMRQLSPHINSASKAHLRAGRCVYALFIHAEPESGSRCKLWSLGAVLRGFGLGVHRGF